MTGEAQFRNLEQAEAAGYSFRLHQFPDYRGFRIIIGMTGSGVYLRMQSRSGKPVYEKITVPALLRGVCEPAAVAEVDRMPPRMRMTFKRLRYDGPVPGTRWVRFEEPVLYYPRSPSNRYATMVRMWFKPDFERVRDFCHGIIDRHLGPLPEPVAATTQPLFNDSLPI